MAVFPQNLSARVPAAALVYIIVSALLLAVMLSTQLGQLATGQQAALGKALGVQLAESLKQPMIDSNVINMQVILDNLLNDTDAVVRATVYSPANRILAQSQRSSPRNADLATYTNPISVDNTMMGQVRVELNRKTLLAHYRSPLWIALAVWLLPTIAFALWLTKTTANYSQRIRTLSACFPTSGDDDSRSELAALEEALEPFTRPAIEEEREERYHFSLVAISIPNLPKWRAQLSADAFESMLHQIDTLIDAHLTLFNGTRLQSRNTAMLVEFGDGGDDHPIITALHFANALLRLCDKLANNEHLPFELRIATAYRAPAVNGSAWHNDLDREECINRLIDMLPLAGAWELYIDKADLNPGDMAGCELEEFSAASVWQFKGYDPELEDLFVKQLNFLSAAT